MLGGGSLGRGLVGGVLADGSVGLLVHVGKTVFRNHLVLDERWKVRIPSRAVISYRGTAS